MPTPPGFSPTTYNGIARFMTNQMDQYLLMNPATSGFMLANTFARNANRILNSPKGRAWLASPWGQMFTEELKSMIPIQRINKLDPRIKRALGLMSKPGLFLYSGKYSIQDWNKVQIPWQNAPPPVLEEYRFTAPPPAAATGRSAVQGQPEPKGSVAPQYRTLADDVRAYAEMNEPTRLAEPKPAAPLPRAAFYNPRQPPPPPPDKSVKWEHIK